MYMYMIAQDKEKFPAGTRVRVTQAYADDGWDGTKKFVGLEGVVLDYAGYDVYTGVKLDRLPDGADTVEYGTLLVNVEEIERI